MEINAEFHPKFKPLFEPHRYKVYYGGRAGLKSWSFARALLILGTQKPLRILCTREVQRSIKDSVHKLLSDQIQMLGLGLFYEVVQSAIRGKNGTEFIFAGLRTETAESIKSYEGVDIVWVEEADALSDKSWVILIPTIRKPGSEIWVSFNPDLEHDPVYQRFVVNPPPTAVVVKVSYLDNKWLSSETLAEIKHMRENDYDEYLHVYEGELKIITEGAIYAKQLAQMMKDGRICDIPIQPSAEINTFWDLGKGQNTAIWFHQRIGKEDRFIDYYQVSGNILEDLDHFIRVVKAKNYNYGTHYLPHDVEHEILGLGNRTRKQMLEDGGVKPIKVVPRVKDIAEGIEITRNAMASVWIDKTRCAEGLKALRNYRYKFDEDKQVYYPEPVHDWASHPADAFRQFAQGYTENTILKPLKYPNLGIV